MPWEEIERYDAAHARTLRAYFAIEQEDALLYHVIFNSERLPVEACVAAVCQLAEHPMFQAEPATTQSMFTDKLLAAKINSALAEHISLIDAPSGITVSVSDGKVTLAGLAGSGAVRNKAEKVAREIDGVVEVNNRIIEMPTR